VIVQYLGQEAGALDCFASARQFRCRSHENAALVRQ
jgi:hypothetical protein